MLKNRKICFQLTARRILGSILAAVSMLNVFIVGAVFMAAPPPSALTSTWTVSNPALTSTLATSTVILPTHTSTQTPSLTPTQTFTFTATHTLTATHTATQTPSLTMQPTDTFTSSPTPCTPWSVWPVYIIQRGDTLSRLASATGSTVNELMWANCLTSDRIYSGQPLYVPRLPTSTPTVPPTQPALACATFDDLEPGMEYPVGKTFLTPDFSVTVDLFAFEDGSSKRTGLASVTSEESEGGYGSQVQARGVNLIFNLSSVPSQLSFLFGEYGGNLNMHVNGDFRNFENFADLDGLVVGGTKVAVLKGYGNDFGYLQLSGAIRSFAVGGQDLWIDNVCLST